MSDVSQGPGWWEASDDKWYPPEEHPDYRPPRPPPPPRPAPTDEAATMSSTLPTGAMPAVEASPSPAALPDWSAALGIDTTETPGGVRIVVRLLAIAGVLAAIIGGIVWGHGYSVHTSCVAGNNFIDNTIPNA